MRRWRLCRARHPLKRGEDGIDLDHAGRALPVIPGMTASVDVLTGERSILYYLLKPINKASQKALTER
jgi:adhesin transport system membrane fusion protein